MGGCRVHSECRHGEMLGTEDRIDTSWSRHGLGHRTGEVFLFIIKRRGAMIYERGVISPDGKKATFEPTQVFALWKAFIAKLSEKTQEIAAVLQDRGISIID